MQTSRYMVRRDCILCKPFNHDSHFVVLSPSHSPWYDPQFQVLRVAMFRFFSSSKISIYKSPFLPEPTIGAVCRKGGPETEFATAGT